MNSNAMLIRMKDVAKDLNDLTFTDYFYRLMLISRSVFKWEGLPNGIDEKYIERYLFTDGKCCFFKDSEKGYMIAKCNPAGQLNFYDEPTIIQAYGTNYNSKKLKNYEESVIIRNNDEMIPTSMSVQLFALRLAEISRTIDININAQKTPVLVLSSDKQRLTLKNVYKQWTGFEPVIYGDKQLETQNITVLKTDAPVVFPQLQIQKHAIWNETMTFLGINNANMDKRERLVGDEVQANNEQIEASANVMLKSRESACEQINKLFGTSISVSFRTSQNGSNELKEDTKKEEEKFKND